MENELLIKRTQALTLWFLIDSEFQGDLNLPQLNEFQGSTIISQLQKLLAYFEPDYAHTFVVYSILMSLTVHSSAIDAVDQALYFGNRSLNLAKDWQDLYWISFAADRLADIKLKMGLPGEAVSYLLDTLEWHLAIGQVWQTLGYLWSKPIRFVQLFGGVENIVPVISMVYHHPDSTPFYRQEVLRVRPQFETEIGQERFAAGWQEGKSMDFDSAVVRVRSCLSNK